MFSKKIFPDLSFSILAIIVIMGASMLACAPEVVRDDTLIPSRPETVDGEEAAIGSSNLTQCIPAQEQEIGFVTYIYDGDTISVLIDDEEYRVRYIGMDTPEREEYFYQEATDRNSELVYHKNVVLIKDVSETDRYGRLLRYVLVDGMFVNHQLVTEGYAVTVTFPPDVACVDTFREAERQAQDNLAGLWK